MADPLHGPAPARRWLRPDPMRVGVSLPPAPTHGPPLPLNPGDGTGPRPQPRGKHGGQPESDAVGGRGHCAPTRSGTFLPRASAPGARRGAQRSESLARLRARLGRWPRGWREMPCAAEGAVPSWADSQSRGVGPGGPGRSPGAPSGCPECGLPRRPPASSLPTPHSQGPLPGSLGRHTSPPHGRGQ